MTTPAADKPDQANAANPGAIDLKPIRASYCEQFYHGRLDPCQQAIFNLIAAVEALRERVVELEGMLEKADKELFDTLVDYTKLVDSNRAAEARVVEMALLVKECASLLDRKHREGTWAGFNPDYTKELYDRLCAALDATLADALERARAVEDLAGAVARFCDESQEAGATEYNAMVEAYNKLGALGKEEE